MLSGGKGRGDKVNSKIFELDERSLFLLAFQSTYFPALSILSTIRFTKKKLKFSYIRVFQFRFFQIHSRTRLFVFHSIPRWTRFHCRSIEYFIADARDIYRPGQIKARGNGYELLPRYRLLVQTLIVAGHRIASTCVPAND